MGGSLLPFQRAGVEYMLATRRCYLADQMGLGKTVQALAVVHVGGGYPALIVCPKSLQLNWKGEVGRWLPGARVGTPGQGNQLLEHAPPVLDPFCGGGSIPLEAQRLGLRAYGSDLNPVAVLITKALIEIPPKFAGMPPVHGELSPPPAPLSP